MGVVKRQQDVRPVGRRVGVAGLSGGNCTREFADGRGRFHLREGIEDGPASVVGEYSVPWARFSAFALTFAAPLGLVYLFAQRYIESGLSFGGMEG